MMNEIAKAYPLQWPAGWRRTPSHQRRNAQFKTGKAGYVGPEDERGMRVWKSADRVSIGEGIWRLRRELQNLGVRDENIVISSDLKLRRDGEPHEGQSWSGLDQGVAVYWRVRKETRCMAIDHYDRLPDNLAAIAATIAALRAIERHGGALILDRAFTGFLALPSPEAQELPHQVLGVEECANRDEIEYAYRRLAQQSHPDKGGSVEQMARINKARDAMLGAL